MLDDVNQEGQQALALDGCDGGRPGEELPGEVQVVQAGGQLVSISFKYKLAPPSVPLGQLQRGWVEQRLVYLKKREHTASEKQACRCP